MSYFLAVLPLLAVLGLMILLRWGGQRAGPAGWLAGLLIALLFFGLNGPILWVSQLKGLFLSLVVLAILWPALLLYNIVDQTGGIRAIALGLERWVGVRGLLLVLLAWAFSGLLEGLAGFGLPIAIVAPMLVGLGVPAVQAVAAVAVGHAWSVTFGDMSVIFQTLAAITGRSPAELAPMSALFLGIACIACGIGAALILKQSRFIPVVMLIGALMGAVQYGLAVTPLVPLAALGAGLAGVIGGILAARLMRIPPGEQHAFETNGLQKKPLIAGILSYLFLTIILTVLFLSPNLYDSLEKFVWQVQFPAVETTGRLLLHFRADSILTPAAPGQAYRPLVHPGTYILFTALLSAFLYKRSNLSRNNAFNDALRKTWRSAAPVSVGILFMVGLSTLMDHCGMTYLLARGLSEGLGALFPLVSPVVGVLGAFATGSNNNSNVLFAPLQNNAALLLKIDPNLLLAAQTSGGALGSMIAPAKIIVGCSTAGLQGKDGEVLRKTLPYCLGICLGLGVLALLLT